MADIASRYFAIMAFNNWIILIPFTMMEFAFFCKLYHQTIEKKKYVLVLAGIGMFYTCVELLLNNANNMQDYQSYAKSLTSVFIVIMGLLYIFEQLKKEKKILNRNMYFHGLVLSYFTLEFLFILPINFLINGNESFVYLMWFIRISSLILFYAGLMYFLWKNGKTQKQLHFGL